MKARWPRLNLDACLKDMHLTTTSGQIHVGFDAYRLVPALRSNALSGSSEIAGVTGKLRLDDRNRIRRDLEWAQMKGGAPNPL